MSEPIRLFLGISIPSHVRKKLESFQNQIRPYIDKASWIPPQNMHVTLKFIGNTSSEHIQQINRSCESIAHQHQPFAMYVSGIGSFQDWNKLRVIWVGIKNGTAMSEIAREIDASLHHLGYPRESRPFHPHITLARVKRFRKDKIKKFIEQTLPHLNTWQTRIFVESFHLYRSILKPTGAEYTIISTYSFSR